jgi:hypothetical protein
MAVIQVVVSAECLDLETAVAAEQHVACGDQNILISDGNTAQPPVATPGLEVDVARIQVEELFNLPAVEIDHEYAAMTSHALFAANDRSCYESR